MKFELRNSEGVYLDSVEARNSLHAVCKYVVSLLDDNKAISLELQPRYVSNDLVEDTVDFTSMVNGLYNLNYL